MMRLYRMYLARYSDMHLVRWVGRWTGGQVNRW